MSDDSKGDLKEALTTLALPVYQDLAKPATIQVGLALETVARTVHIALLPLKALCWGADQFSSFLEGKVAEKLRNVSPENIKTPQADIAIPLLESVRLKEHSAPLVDLYAQLLASAIQNRADGQEVHPVTVQVPPRKTVRTTVSWVRPALGRASPNGESTG